MNYPHYICVDGETTGATNGTYGNPFTDGNRLCYIGVGNSNGARGHPVDVRGLPFGAVLQAVDTQIRSGNPIFVGFNIKFDLHWLRRYGVILPSRALVWDCQLAEFIISNQETPLPSLEDTIEKYKLGEKYTLIEDEYWNKGIDTDKIPPEIVLKRVESDVMLTSTLFEMQMDYLKGNPQLRNLIWASCQDQRVLAEMEWNGILFDMVLAKKLGDDLLLEADKITRELNTIVQI